jgi:dienelactone hydrolase
MRGTKINTQTEPERCGQAANVRTSRKPAMHPPMDHRRSVGLVPSCVIFARRSPVGGIRFPAVVVALIAVAAAGLGVWILNSTANGLSRRHVVVGGVPLDEVHPADAATGERRPGIVVAHGFAGSARLMAPFGDTLAARGYVVVLLDFSGHGLNTRPLPDGTAGTDASTAALQHDLDIAMTHLRGLPDVDPSRVAVIGHSMGATAVTGYALAHPEVTATVAVSLPDSSHLLPDRPARLLLLVGGLELASLRTAADHAVQQGGTGRAAVHVPGVEHIGILYAPRTHREVVTWLDDSFGRPASPRPIPSPVRRLSGAALLMLSFLVGLHPVARLLLGGGPPRWPQIAPVATGRIVAVAPAALVAVLVAPIAPTTRLPLALGGYITGFTLTAGVTMLAYHRWRAGTYSACAPVTRHGRLRLAVAAPVLIGYAAVTIAVPLQLGVTNAVPVAARWWLLAVMWAGFAALAYAAECVAGGNSFGVLIVSAATVFMMTCAAIVGAAPGFLLLVVPLFAVLMLWQAIWSAVLHRFSAPTWLISLVGSLLLAWPIATALPMTAR